MVAAGAALRWRGRRAPVASAHWRGRTLRSAAEAGQLLAAARSSTDPGLSLGSLRLPWRAACSHFAIAGATGSGKTLLQRLLMQSALPRIGKGDGHRALLYDAKQDLLPLLGGMDLRATVHILHPLDRCAVAWNMAADIKTPAAALQTASLLIPEIKTDNNPFFANAARHLLTGAINALIEQAGARWNLRHVLLVMRDPVRLGNLLGRSEHTRFLLQYFEHTGTFQNILSTVLTALAPFDTLAASWDRADQQVRPCACLAPLERQGSLTPVDAGGPKPGCEPSRLAWFR
jgi:Type IV secretion-system coupling protein DNA-binding domain